MKCCCQVTCLPLWKLLLPFREVGLEPAGANPAVLLPPSSWMRSWEPPVHPLHGSRGFLLGEMFTGQETSLARDPQCHQACGSPQSKGINPYSWLSPCHFPEPWGRAADGKASRMLLASRSRAQLFPDQDFVLGFSPVGSRLQIPALLILPLTSPPAPRISSQLIQVISGMQLPGRAGPGQG